jgi:hypothetical protein
VPADLATVEDAFLEAAAAIDGINFAEEHDPDVEISGPPGVTLSLIGMAERYVDIPFGGNADVDAEWTVRLYLPYNDRQQAHDDLLAYLPALHAITREVPTGIQDWRLDIGEEPEYDKREGRRKVVKRCTLFATVYSTT